MLDNEEMPTNVKHETQQGGDVWYGFELHRLELLRRFALQRVDARDDRSLLGVGGGGNYVNCAVTEGHRVGVSEEAES